jgi:hypothetical protein
VITHDKFPLDLRVEAAMTLVTMKPRGGRRVGILGNDEFPGLVNALGRLPPAQRNRIIGGIVPRLEAGILAAAPRPQPGKPPEVDDSYSFKDAAFALLTHEGGSLIADDEGRARLRRALTKWALADFATRMDEPSQMFGMEQVLQELKAEGVRQLPDLMEPGQPRVDRMADLIADLGDAGAKLRASQKLVAIAERIDGNAWLEERAPHVQEANRASKLTPSTEQFQAQLKQFQEEELLRTFSSMKRIGGEPVVRFLLAYAQNGQNGTKRRAGALAALEGNLGRNRGEYAGPLLELAKSDDTPDEVRDVALRRVGEMPRSLVIEQLYELFTATNWKVRWVAAELILKMSEVAHVDEFMKRLSAIDGLAMTEPLRYGAMIGAMKGPPEPSMVAARFAKAANPVQTRLTALGYYYEYGTSDDVSLVEPYAADQTKLPACKADTKDCEWECSIGDQTKQVTTLGEFVEYCIKPQMSKRASSAKPEQQKGK